MLKLQPSGHTNPATRHLKQVGGPQLARGPSCESCSGVRLACCFLAVSRCSASLPIMLWYSRARSTRMAVSRFCSWERVCWHSAAMPAETRPEQNRQGLHVRPEGVGEGGGGGGRSYNKPPLTCGQVNHSHGAVGGVDALAPGAPRPEGVDAELLRVDVDVQLRVGGGGTVVRHWGDGWRGGVGGVLPPQAAAAR